MPELIVKHSTRHAVPPNLGTYDETYSGFSWEAIRKELSRLPGGTGLNIAWEAVDRHAAGPLREKVAIRWISKADARVDFTYGELR